MTKKNKRQINIRVSEEEYQKIAETADNKGVSVSDLAKETILNLSATDLLQPATNLLQSATNLLQDEKNELEKKVKKLSSELEKMKSATDLLQNENEVLQTATSLLQKDLEDFDKLKSDNLVLQTKFIALEEKNALFTSILEEKREEVASLKKDKEELYRLFDQQQQLINGNKFVLPNPKKSFFARLFGK